MSVVQQETYHFVAYTFNKQTLKQLNTVMFIARCDRHTQYSKIGKKYSKQEIKIYQSPLMDWHQKHIKQITQLSQKLKTQCNNQINTRQTPKLFFNCCLTILKLNAITNSYTRKTQIHWFSPNNYIFTRCKANKQNVENYHFGRHSFWQIDHWVRRQFGSFL